MSGGQRVVLIVVAAVIAVGAFLVLRPDDEDSNDSADTTTQPATAQTEPEVTTPSETQPTPEPEQPKIETLTVKDGEIVGGLETLEAKKGDTVQFQVRSDAAHEIHLHGYDIAKDVTPDKPVRFKLKATETGIFEIEIEDTKTQIAELKVEP